MKDYGKVTSYNGRTGYIIDDKGQKVLIIYNSVIDKSIKEGDLVTFDLEEYKDVEFTKLVARFVKKIVPDYNIRLAKTSDSMELSKLKHTVWNTTYKGIYSDERLNNYDFELHKDKFDKRISDPESNVYVVTNDNKIVGYIIFGKPFKPFKDYKQEISQLYILKDYQGQHLGTKLFNLAYEKMKESGFTEFFVACNKYNIPAQRFYEAKGGEIISIDENLEQKSREQIKYLYEIK